jgi:hypothetical protein
VERRRWGTRLPNTPPRENAKSAKRVEGAPAGGLEPPIVALTGRCLTIWPHRYHEASILDPVGMAGFEPAISCSRSRRINQAFPHPGSSAQRESNPHIRLGKAVGCHYIMGTLRPRPNCQRDRGHRVGLEPTSPHYGCGVFAARRPVQSNETSARMGPEGLEPSPTRLRAGRSATRALVPNRLRSVGPEGVEPSSSGYQPNALDH